MFPVKALDDRLALALLSVLVCLLADGFRPYVLVCGTLCLVGWALLERASWQDRKVASLRKVVLAQRDSIDDLECRNEALRQNNKQLTHYRCEQIADEIHIMNNFNAQRGRHNNLLKMLEPFTMCLNTLSVGRDECRRVWNELVSKYYSSLVYVDMEPLDVPDFRSLTVDIPAKYVEMFKLEAEKGEDGKLRYFMPGDGVKPRVPFFWSYRNLTMPNYYREIDQGLGNARLLRQQLQKK